MLRLPSSDFSVVQVDVDGAALKALGMSATLAQHQAQPARPIDEPERAGIPALRSGGVALVHHGRAAALQSDFAQALQQNNALQQNALAELRAEDLTRGYRLDVWDAADTWHSLHGRVLRVAALAFAEELPPVSDEGFFQIGVAGAATPPGQQPDPNGELYVHETLVTWDGWSLSAPRPGKSINRSPDAATPPERVPNRAMTAMQLEIEPTIQPGSLPRLRFGHEYRLRVRTVDLAGNGLTVDEANRVTAAGVPNTVTLPTDNALHYCRFEPLAAPVLVPRARYAEGESLERLVIRSNRDVSAADYAAAFNQSDLVQNQQHAPYQPQNERHLAAPKVALQPVEVHGMLDDVFGSDGQPPDEARRAAIRAAYDIARREQGSLVDPTLPTVELVNTSSDPAVPQQYAVHTEEQLVLPYLPDPLARGVVFVGLPSAPDSQPFVVRFDAPTWDAPVPFRLQLVEGQGAPVWDAASHVLTVQMPQATVATVRVCSLFDGPLEDMGLLAWCREAVENGTLSPDDFERVMDAAKQSRHWMVTPWHDVTLVHAVQQPLVEPQIVEFEPSRNFGEIAVDLFGAIELHRPSTDKVSLIGAWSEPVDDLSQPGPETRAAETAIFSLSLDVAALERDLEYPHEVPYSLRDERLLTFNSRMARARSLATPAAHTFGDTKYRRVAYRIVAASRFREYFPPAFAAQPGALASASQPVTLDILNSAPPAAPRVLYAVPTFGWETTADGAAITSVRRGGSLRIYLARPWFSSGDGELLGVVLGGALTTPSSDEYPYISLLGQDPLWNSRASQQDPLWSSAALAFPTPTSFRNVVQVGERVPLVELPRKLVTVLGFTPQYDPATRRWFCDIELDTKEAYTPFVRLALVRYQPHSLEQAHISRVVLADILQTLPDRTVTITPDAAQPASLAVAVNGPSIAARRDPTGAIVNAPTMVEATLEQRAAAIADETLGWEALPGTTVSLVPEAHQPSMTWRGRVTLPDGDGSLRLVIREYEPLFADDMGGAGSVVARRLVFVDTIPLQR
jgi:hypothetical protein